MRRGIAAAAVVVLLGSAMPWAACVAQDGAKPSAPAAATEQEQTLYATPTRRDRVGRVLAPVEVNGQGSFRFIVDTGANRSAVSPRLVATLGLETVPDARIDVHGVTGSAELPAIDIERLRAGEIDLGRVRAPVLSDSVFAGADGILGVDGLQGSRIEVDFVNDRVSISRSTGRRAPSGFMTVPASLQLGGLLLVDGSIAGGKVKVIIDTGAAHTLGNVPLRDYLMQRGAERQAADATVIGATPATLEGITFIAPRISLGRTKLRNLPVTFGDMHVFRVWGLEHEPALLIGMDLLGTLEQFIVDYGRHEFQLKPRASKDIGIQRCTVNCGTRVPSDR
jgi:predicted aspartyl protease